MAIQQLEVEQLKAAIERGEVAYLIDVREPSEFGEAHVPGALSYPLSTFLPSKLPWAKTTSLALICRSGGRSMTAAQILVEAGFCNISNVVGGTLAWQQATFATESGSGGG